MFPVPLSALPPPLAARGATVGRRTFLTGVPSKMEETGVSADSLFMMELRLHWTPALAGLSPPS